MKLLRDIEETPYRFDFFDVLRQFERTYPEKPRIGDSDTLEQEFLLLGQHPYMEFPASNVAALQQDSHQRYRLLVRFEDYTDPALPYMYHCHMLLHEDEGMMGQFVVIEPGQEDQVGIAGGAGHGH